MWDWHKAFKRNLVALTAAQIVPETAPNREEYIRELEARINQKDIAIDALLIENEQLDNVIRKLDTNYKVLKMKVHSNYQRRYVI